MTPTLFDPDVMLDTVTVGPYRQSEPSTSREAAESLHGLAESHRRCLQAIVNAGEHGMTDDELFAAVESPTVSERYIAATRRGFLRDQGFVVASGRKRKSAKGHNAEVWVSTAEGREVAARMGESDRRKGYGRG